MQETFTKEITFLSKTLTEVADGPAQLIDTLVTKTATFKELRRTEKEQHKLHFKIVSLFGDAKIEEEEEGTVVNDGDRKIVLSTDKIYDITLKSIRTLLVIDPKEKEGGFNEQDMAEFLQDSGALFNFGLWFLGDKLTPFFSEMRK